MKRGPKSPKRSPRGPVTVDSADATNTSFFARHFFIKILKSWTWARSYNLTTMATMVGGTKLSEEAHLTGSIRAFVANQVNVAISRFLGLKCASNILRFDSNVPPQMCLLKCASSMCLLNAGPL